MLVKSKKHIKTLHTLQKFVCAVRNAQIAVITFASKNIDFSCAVKKCNKSYHAFCLRLKMCPKVHINNAQAFYT